MAARFGWRSLASLTAAGGLALAAGAGTSSAQTPVVTATPRPAPTATSPNAPSAAAAQQPFLLTATLNGLAEVPGPGNVVGLGSAAVLADQGRNMVCYALHVINIGTPVAAHIHEAAVDAAGPVVVPFSTPTGENSSGCVSNVEAAVVSRLMDNPSGFYVNVHTSDFPDGAVRGQLGR